MFHVQICIVQQFAPSTCAAGASVSKFWGCLCRYYDRDSTTGCRRGLWRLSGRHRRCSAPRLADFCCCQLEFHWRLLAEPPLVLLRILGRRSRHGWGFLFFQRKYNCKSFKNNLSSIALSLYPYQISCLDLIYHLKISNYFLFKTYFC